MLFVDRIFAFCFFLSRSAQVFLWSIGIFLLSLSAHQSLLQGPVANKSVQQFLHQASAESAVAPPSLAVPASIDTRLWSATRIQDFTKAGESAADELIGVMSISGLSLDAPIYSGATDDNLDRGLAWLSKTAALDSVGNTAIAGHRDSFFRVLKDIKTGEGIAITTLSGVRRYRVTNIQIVLPSQVEVLAPTDHSQLTLITCYPFYFVGSAPERYIVTATEDTLAQLH